MTTRIGLSQGCIEILPRAMAFLNKSEVSAISEDFPHLVLSDVVLLLQFPDDVFQPDECRNSQWTDSWALIVTWALKDDVVAEHPPRFSPMMTSCPTWSRETAYRLAPHCLRRALRMTGVHGKPDQVTTTLCCASFWINREAKWR